MKSIGIDVETTGLDLYHGCEVFSLAIASGDDEFIGYWTFPVDPITAEVTYSQESVVEIQSIIDSYDLCIFHNAAFDYLALRKMGIRIPWEKVRDTLIDSHLLYSLGPHGLKHLKVKHLNLPAAEEEELAKIVIRLRRKAKKRGFNLSESDNPRTPSAKEGKWKGDMWLVNCLGTRKEREILKKYNIADAMDTWALYQVTDREIKERGDEPQRAWRMDSLKTAISMRHKGITLRKSSIREAWQGFRSVMRESERVCRGIAPSVNPESVDQLQVLFFEEWKLPHTQPTEGGGYSLDVGNLNWLLEKNLDSNQRTYIESILTSRKMGTAIGYMKDYIRYSVPVEDHEDYVRIHSSFNVTGTAWTRLSSSAPNQQNVSKDKKDKRDGTVVKGLRSVYSPLPGEVWYCIDQENVELRIFAYDSGEGSLIKAYEEGKAVHLIFAAIVYPAEWEQAGNDGDKFKKLFPNLYDMVKNGDFSLIYGAGQKKADKTYGVPGAYARIRHMMPEIDSYMRKFQRDATKKGFILTIGGYRLYVSPDKPHKASNGRIQGTASEILQKTSNKVRDFLAEHHPCCSIISNIHDEVIIRAPADYDFPFEEVYDLLTDSGLEFEIPVKFERVTTSWDQKEVVQWERKRQRMNSLELSC